MSIFSLVKENVSAKDVAEYYGLKVKENGMACCPFHNDKTPSMKLNDRFYCFGCGEKGDAIDFVAKYFGLNPKEAAYKICADFGLKNLPRGPTKAKTLAQQNDVKMNWKTEKFFCNIVSEYYHCLQKWKKEYAPRSPDEEPHPYFVEALHEADRIEYLLDTLLEGSIHDRVFLFSKIRREIDKIEKRLQEIKQSNENDRGKKDVKKRVDGCR